MSAIALALAPHHGRLGEAPAPGAPCPDETGTMVALAIGGALLGTIAGVAISSFWPTRREAAHHQEIARLQKLLEERDRTIRAHENQMEWYMNAQRALDELREVSPR